jgi:hypothetical protein
LKAEVDLLRSQILDSGAVPLTAGPGGKIVSKDIVVHQLKEELDQREKLITEMNKSWEQKLKEAENKQVERKTALQDMGVAIKVSLCCLSPDDCIQAVSSLPHFINLNEDPLMSESLIYYFKDGKF